MVYKALDMYAPPGSDLEDQQAGCMIECARMLTLSAKADSFDDTSFERVLQDSKLVGRAAAAGAH